MAFPLPASLQKSLNETKVEYVRLGDSGLRVSFPILGTMGFGSSKWLPWVLDEEESIKLLKAAYDIGMNTWDTANMYSNGLSEQVIGKAIKQHKIPRDKVILITKCFVHMADEVEIFGAALGSQMTQSKDYTNAGGESI